MEVEADDPIATSGEADGQSASCSWQAKEQRISGSNKAAHFAAAAELLKARRGDKLACGAQGTRRCCSASLLPFCCSEKGFCDNSSCHDHTRLLAIKQTRRGRSFLEAPKRRPLERQIRHGLAPHLQCDQYESQGQVVERSRVLA